MKTRKPLGRGLLAAIALAIAPNVAFADSDTDTFTVSARVLASCEVDADDLAFGDYNPVVASHLDASTTLNVVCTSGTGYDVGLSLGGGTGASVATRRMASGGNLLNYVLYRDSNRTQLWGTTVNTNTLHATGDGTSDTVNVYGRIPMQQAVPSGNYQDTITVTVSW